MNGRFALIIITGILAAGMLGAVFGALVGAEDSFVPAAVAGAIAGVFVTAATRRRRGSGAPRD